MSGPGNLMVRRILCNPDEVAIAASQRAADTLKSAIQQRGEARLVAATGQSQLKLLELLTQRHDVDWSRVILFHLDEFMGVDPRSAGSMQRYIVEHIVNPTGIPRAYLLDGTNPTTSAQAAAAQLAASPADLTLAGL